MPWSKHNYQFDAQGNTRALVDTSAGQITDTFTYDAWGNEVLRTGTSKENFTWNGRVGYFRDRDTNSYQVRRRPYRPKVGRWSSRDPLWPIDGSHAYEYSINSPVIFCDPSGLETATVDPIAGIPKDKKCKDKCGPDVTEWFYNDLVSQLEHVKAALKLTPPELASKTFRERYVQTARFGFAYKWLSYPTSSSCATGVCNDTVWLVDTCLTAC